MIFRCSAKRLGALGGRFVFKVVKALLSLQRTQRTPNTQRTPSTQRSDGVDLITFGVARSASVSSGVKLLLRKTKLIVIKTLDRIKLAK